MEGLADIGGFETPVNSRILQAGSDAAVRIDPFAGPPLRFPVAPGTRAPTVNAGRTGGRQLSAILIADDRPVAVIDGTLVNVGDVLPDGGRVAAIRPDRVAISERNGQMRVLTLSRGGPR